MDGQGPADADPNPIAAERVAAALARVREASARGDLADAARWADRAARLAPGQDLIEEILGRLERRLGRLEAALGHLRAAAELRSTPARAAEIAETLHALGDASGAASELKAALGRFAIVRGGPLEAACRRILIETPADAPGWVGLTPELEAIGEIRGGGATDLRLFRSGTKSAPALLEPFRAGGGRHWRFSLRAPLGFAGPIGAVVGRAPLLGGDGAFPPDPRLHGRCRASETALEGWASFDWSPEARPQVLFGGDEDHLAEAAVADAPDPMGRWTFRADLEAGGGDRLQVFARGPDGRLHTFPDSPALRRLPPEPQGRALGPSASRAAVSGLTDIIIPVYRGREETLACIAAVQAHSHGLGSIIVVDDASPEPELSEALLELAKRGEILLLRNSENLGFPGAVNRGLDASDADRDVVVLNADTEVYDGWLTTLRTAAAGDATVGTLTPLSNAGAIASYPRGGGPCSSEEGARLAEMAEAANGGVLVDAPTGVGFCLYIRRACLDDVGALDEAAFGRGYGEENDFCRRAARLGWRNAIAPGVFVRHLEGRSYGESRSALMDRNLDVLVRRHPDYLVQVAAFAGADPLLTPRRRLAEATFDGGADVLLLAHGLGGGIERHLEMRRDALRADGLVPMTVRPERGRAGERSDVVCVDVDGGLGVEDLRYRGDEAADLIGFLRRQGLQRVELHHFYGVPPDLLEIPSTLGIPYSVHLHDYAFICPRFHMVGGDDRYCGAPPPEACQACVDAHGAFVEDLSVEAYLERSRRWLEGAEAVHAPTADAAVRIGERFPGIDVLVGPLEAEVFPSTRSSARRRDVATVAVIGALNEGKGFSLLLACAAEARRLRRPLRFVVIGYTKDDPSLEAAGDVFVTGSYRHDEIGALLEREDPDVVLFPNVAPETWSFTLTEALSAARPVVALDIGAVPERLRRLDVRSKLLPLDAGPEAINDALLEAAGLNPIGRTHPEELEPLADREGVEPPPSPARRAAATPLVYRNPEVPDAMPTERHPSPEPPRPGDTEQKGRRMVTTAASPRATVQLLMLPVGLYRFSVVTEASAKAPGDDLPLPAVQISSGPGAPPDSIDYLGNPGHDGGWLFNENDTLVLRVKLSRTPIFVTSYSREGAEPLEIEVEKVAAERRGKRTESQPALGSSGRAALPPPAPPATGAAVGGSSRRRSEDGRPAVPLRVLAHISREGDVAFMDQPVIGRPERRLAIEGFAIEPLGQVSARDIEYKTLSEKGVESPWTRGGGFSGTRQMALALSGFSIRLRGEKATSHECRYTGIFQSGARVGPRADGAPVMGTSLSDALVGMEIEILERAAAPAAGYARPQSTDATASAPAGRPASRRVIGPRFGVFREDD